MDARLVLAFTGDGQFRVFLLGKGKARAELLRGFSQYIEPSLDDIKGKVKKALGVQNANSNPHFH
jgi:hypothetical protein